MRIAYVSVPREPIGIGLVPRGSVGIVVCNTARELAKQHAVTIYAPQGKDEPAVERSGGVLLRRVGPVARMLHEGLDLLGCLFPSLPAHTHSRLYAREYYTKVAAALRSDPVDAIVLQTFAQAAPLLRRACPHATLAVQAHDLRLAFMPAPQISRDLRDVDVVITVSQYLGDELLAAHAFLSDRIAVVPNGVDVSAFLGSPLAQGDGDASILYVGRLSPEKGVHVLMQAMNRVIERRPDARLDLVGQPGLLPYTHLKLLHADPHIAALDRYYGVGLKQRIRQQVLAPGTEYAASLRKLLSPAGAAATHFLGRVLHSDLPARYASAGVVVFPSVWQEPFGMPLVEAMASGVPVIGTRAGAMPEILGDERGGLLVERSDPEALANAILTVLDNPQRRRAMGKAGRERAARQFTWARAAMRLESALDGGREHISGRMTAGSAATERAVG